MAAKGSAVSGTSAPASKGQCVKSQHSCQTFLTPPNSNA